MARSSGFANNYQEDGVGRRFNVDVRQCATQPLFATIFFSSPKKPSDLPLAYLVTFHARRPGERNLGIWKLHGWWYTTLTYILRLCGEGFLVGFFSRSFMFSNELSIGSVVSLAAVLYWSQPAKGGIAGSGLYKSGVLLRLWIRVSRQKREKRSCAQLLNLATTDLRWPSNVKNWK